MIRTLNRRAGKAKPLLALWLRLPASVVGKLRR
jgi:hypothetical protein